jgi:hypothetical protein
LYRRPCLECSWLRPNDRIAIDNQEAPAALDCRPDAIGRGAHDVQAVWREHIQIGARPAWPIIEEPAAQRYVFAGYVDVKMDAAPA